MSEIMAHPWMNEGHALPFGPAPYPNRLDLLDLDKDIVEHMVYALKVGQTVLNWHHTSLPSSHA